MLRLVHPKKTSWRRVIEPSAASILVGMKGASALAVHSTRTVPTLPAHGTNTSTVDDRNLGLGAPLLSQPHPPSTSLPSEQTMQQPNEAQHVPRQDLGVTSTVSANPNDAEIATVVVPLLNRTAESATGTSKTGRIRRASQSRSSIGSAKNQRNLLQRFVAACNDSSSWDLDVKTLELLARLGQEAAREVDFELMERLEDTAAVQRAVGRKMVQKLVEHKEELHEAIRNDLDKISDDELGKLLSMNGDMSKDSRRAVMTSLLNGANGMVFGSGIGQPAHTQKWMIEALNLSSEQYSGFTSVFFGGVFGGSLLASRISAKDGDLSTLKKSSVLAFLSGLLYILAPQLLPLGNMGTVVYWLVVLARTLLGVAAGITNVVTSQYILGTLKHSAGKVVNQQFITIGILLAMIMGISPLFGSASLSSGWPLGLGLLPLGLGASLGLVASRSERNPRFLVSTGKYEEAVKAMQHLTQVDISKMDPEIQEKMKEFEPHTQRLIQICRELAHVQSISGKEIQAGEEESPALTRIYRKLMNWVRTCGRFLRNNSWPFLILWSLNLLQQGTGIDPIISLGSIWETSDNSTAVTTGLPTSEVNNLVIGSVNVAATLLAPLIVGRFGLQRVFNTGLVGMGAALSAFTGGRLLDENSTQLVSMMAFIATFAITAGPVVWPLGNMYFNRQDAPTANGLAAAFNAICSIVLMWIMPLMMEGLGDTVLLPFAGLMFLGAVWVWFTMPDDRNLNQHELMRDLRTRRVQNEWLRSRLGLESSARAEDVEMQTHASRRPSITELSTAPGSEAGSSPGFVTPRSGPPSPQTTSPPPSTTEQSTATTPVAGPSRNVVRPQTVRPPFQGSYSP